MIRQKDVLLACQIRIVVDGRVQVEQERQVHRFLRVEKLILETKTLNLVEVQRRLLWENLVNCQARNRLIRPVIHLVEG